MQASLARRLIGLALAGAASAILSFLISMSGLGLLGPGAVLGLVLVACLARFDEIMTRSRGMLFVCACSAAYAAAVLSFLFLGDGMHEQSSTTFELASAPARSVFGAGTLGAFLVLVPAALLFTRARPNLSSIGLAALGSVGGGALALLGVRSGRVPLWGGELMWLFLVWQTGVSLLLGALLLWMRHADTSISRAASPGRVGPLVTKIVFALVFGVVAVIVGFYLVRPVQDYFEESRANARYKQVQAEAPTRKGLTPVAAVAPMTRCVPSDFGKWRFEGASTYAGGTTAPLRTPFASPASCHYRATDPSARISIRDAHVELIEVPNVAWARYLVKSATVEHSAFCPKCVTRPMRFAGRVVRISEDNAFYPEIYLWSSGTSFVQLTVEDRRVPEDMLNRYLEKYPSDFPPGELLP